VFDVYRKLPPVRNRKRVSRKVCPFGGDYLVDVDEGILEEVRIFNEELNIPTKASCEGHLPRKMVNAYILGKISRNQRKLLHGHMEDIGKHCKTKDNVSRYVFYEKDYRLTFSLFDKCLKDYGNRFRINVRSNTIVKLQDRWDNIRKTGFENAVNILKQIF
jgi:hypothetical protein